ncbi:MAG: hypothetical protein LBG78_07260 [Azoarcus sp.]|jgi:4-amino-4-deoxy-L-arabinose transferase-like glycosyltransferase|nr:hypothetical protein [Azoarcus sp.]
MAHETRILSIHFLHRHLYGTAGLALLIGLYLLTGLTGHEPWRGDDARYFGSVYSMLQGEGLLFPQIAGEPFVEYPPLYYWCAALLSFITQGVLSPHEGIRLASVLFTALTVYWVAASAGRLYGQSARIPAALLIFACLGLILHSHETQPLLALMAMTSLVISGITLVPERPLQGSLQAGLGCTLAILSTGISGMLLTVPLFVLAIVASPECRTPRASGGLLAGLTLAACAGGLWPLLLHLQQPELFALWRQRQWQHVAGHGFSFNEVIRLAKLLSWFLWPLWPLAFWALWHERKRLFHLRWLLPILSVIITLIFLIFSADPSQATLLPLLPPMALLAAGGLPTLRRGAANAFDWFSAMTFGILAILVWIAWTSLMLSWPPGFARYVARIAPAFALDNAWLRTFAGILICVLWFCLAWRLPRRPERGAANWAMGVTMLWCLAVTLLLPWFDHSRSYRDMISALNKALVPYAGECVTGNKLPDPVRSMLDYYAKLRTVPASSDTASCRLLLTYTDYRTENAADTSGWELIGEWGRGGGKQLETLRLFIRPDQ